MQSELLNILVCPETKQPLRMLNQAELSELNLKIQSGEVFNRSGVKCIHEVSGLLVREDGRVGYQVRDGIPVMLVEESLNL